MGLLNFSLLCPAPSPTARAPCSRFTQVPSIKGLTCRSRLVLQWVEKKSHFQGVWGPPEPPRGGSCLPPWTRGWRRAAWQGRFGSVDFIISTVPAERMFVNGLSAGLDSFSSPFPCIRPILGYLQPYHEGLCSCQESWMLQVSFECAITAGNSPFPPF